MKPIPIDPQLRKALEEARSHVMTEEEIFEQRISFAYGNVSLHNPSITKDMVRAAAEELYGRPKKVSKTREDYEREKIIAATTALKSLTQCPSCKQSAENNSIGTRQTGAMDVDVIYCQHPYHTTRYDDGSGQMLALGLPNHRNFDKSWIKEMQEAAIQYALANNL